MIRGYELRRMCFHLVQSPCDFLFDHSGTGCGGCAEIVRISCIFSALSCSLRSLRTHKRAARSWFVCCWIAAGGLLNIRAILSKLHGQRVATLRSSKEIAISILSCSLKFYIFSTICARLPRGVHAWIVQCHLRAYDFSSLS